MTPGSASPVGGVGLLQSALPIFTDPDIEVSPGLTLQDIHEIRLARTRDLDFLVDVPYAKCSWWFDHCGRWLLS